MTMKMIATKAMRYGTRALSVGDPFTVVSRRDQRLLQALGRAKFAEAPSGRSVKGDLFASAEEGRPLRKSRRTRRKKVVGGE